jgi:hypothetical protein
MVVAVLNMSTVKVSDGVRLHRRPLLALRKVSRCDGGVRGLKISALHLHGAEPISYYFGRLCLMIEAQPALLVRLPCEWT